MNLNTRRNSPSTLSEILDSQKPLVVDIDGTLASRDIFASSFIQVILEKPWLLIRFFKMIFGRKIASLKTELAESRVFDWPSHPKNQELIALLENQAKLGREVFLCSGAAEKHVRIVSDSLGFISNQWGSTEFENLTGKNKASKLTQIFGVREFDYIGDSHNDRHVSYVANQSVILARKRPFTALLRQLRPAHWVKNLLVFVPLIAAHEVTDSVKLASLSAAFVALSLMASATYSLNDLADLDHDLAHQEKRKRPLASGEVTLGMAVLVMFTLVSASLTLAWTFLPTTAFIGIAGYAVLSALYSSVVKKVLGLDAVFIALLFVYRILLGFLVADLELSPWLIMFGFFLFLSLALSKRYTELLFSGRDRLPGRPYSVVDSSLVGQAGLLSGFSAVLVFAIYINSPQVLELYTRPEMLWFGVPALSFWVIHLWTQTNRNNAGHDPLIWALKDTSSLIVAVIGLTIMYLAI